MANNIHIGVMGCGNISTTYFKLSPLFKGIEIVACADLNPEMAKTRAQEYGVPAMKPAKLLASKNVDLILNLTVPDAHFGVSLAAIARLRGIRYISITTGRTTGRRSSVLLR